MLPEANTPMTTPNGAVPHRDTQSQNERTAGSLEKMLQVTEARVTGRDGRSATSYLSLGTPIGGPKKEKKGTI